MTLTNGRRKRVKNHKIIQHFDALEPQSREGRGDRTGTALHASSQLCPATKAPLDLPRVRGSSSCSIRRLCDITSPFDCTGLDVTHAETPPRRAQERALVARMALCRVSSKSRRGVQNASQSSSPSPRVATAFFSRLAPFRDAAGRLPGWRTCFAAACMSCRRWSA